MQPPIMPAVNSIETDSANQNGGVADFNRFELLCLKGSPYSMRVRWALQLLEVDDYAVLKHDVCSGELYLRYKVGRWNPWYRVTVPVAFVSYQDNRPMLVLENGMDIVDWANDVAIQRHASSTGKDNADLPLNLIPTFQRKEILEYCRIADETLEYGRGHFLAKCAENPSLLKRFMGDESPPDFVLPILARVSSMFMRTKYRSTLLDSETKLKGIQINLGRIQAFIEVTQQQTKTKACHLVGNAFTLADLYMAVAVFCPSIDLGDDAGDEWNIRKNYPVLYDWAVAISEVFRRDVS
jgi:hypothetical protein